MDRANVTQEYNASDANGKVSKPEVSQVTHVEGTDSHGENNHVEAPLLHDVAHNNDETGEETVDEPVEVDGQGDTDMAEPQLEQVKSVPISSMGQAVVHNVTHVEEPPSNTHAHLDYSVSMNDGTMQTSPPVSQTAVPLPAAAPDMITSYVPMGDAQVVTQAVPVRRRTTERYHPTPEQVKVLTASFGENPNPSAQTLHQLTEQINMPLQNLVLWFKNKRARSKTKPRVAGQRRSYVKSGIYSRASKRPMPQSFSKLEVVSTDNRTAGATQNAEVSNATVTPMSNFEGGASPQNGVRASDALEHGPSKRPRFACNDSEEEVTAVMQAPNPCRSWTSRKCLRTFTIFFNNHTDGDHGEQLKAAEAVASDFFSGEMQSGLTLTSIAQPIKRSLEILETLIEKRNKEGTTLLSGTKSILGEYIVQIHNGEAHTLEDVNPADDHTNLEHLTGN